MGRTFPDHHEVSHQFIGLLYNTFLNICSGGKDKAGFKMAGIFNFMFPFFQLPYLLKVPVSKNIEWDEYEWIESVVHPVQYFFQRAHLCRC